MSVTIEPVAWIVRSGPKHEKFGDPYDTVCTAVKADEETVRFAGLVGEMTPRTYTQARLCFLALGLRVFSWVRHRD